MRSSPAGPGEDPPLPDGARPPHGAFHARPPAQRAPRSVQPFQIHEGPHRSVVSHSVLTSGAPMRAAPVLSICSARQDLLFN